MHSYTHRSTPPAIVRSTIDLGHNLGMRVVAEGVGDQRTLDLLAGLGCDQVQGFFVGMPVPAAEASLLLSSAG